MRMEKECALMSLLQSTLGRKQNGGNSLLTGYVVRDQRNWMASQIFANDSGSTMDLEMKTATWLFYGIQNQLSVVANNAVLHKATAE